MGGQAIRLATVLMARVVQVQAVMVPSRMVLGQLYRPAGCMVRIHGDQLELIPIPEPPICCAERKARQHTRSENHDSPAKEGQRKLEFVPTSKGYYIGADIVAVSGRKPRRTELIFVYASPQ